MDWGLILGIAIGVPFALGVTALAVRNASTGRDLEMYEALRQVNPSYFRNLVWVCRTNCILVALLNLGIILGTIISCLITDFGWVLSLFAIPFCGIWLWISLRWATWAWRTKLTSLR